MASAIAMYPVNLSKHVNTSTHRPCMPSYAQTQGRAQGGVGAAGGGYPRLSCVSFYLRV